MKPEYLAWIEQKLASEDPHHKCSEWTKEMASAFPELTRVRGHVTLHNGLTLEHWWLTDDAGIVDPTVKQFSQSYYGHTGVSRYDPLDETQPEPTGKCPNCGEYCYGGNSLCSKSCEAEYMAYLNQT